jgi:hypothetical protein
MFGLFPLRQSTASQEVPIGPFLDDTDGKTAETGLTIANTDIKLWKTGATSEASKNSGGATHMASGRYYAVLDATDSDTLGPLEINVHVSGALPCKLRCIVLPPLYYDALVLGVDFLPVDIWRMKWAITGATVQPKKQDGTTNADYSRNLATDGAAQPITGAS